MEETLLTEFRITDDNIIHTPYAWYDKTGYWRSAGGTFVMSKQSTTTGRWSAPLSPVNLEDIFAKLPEGAEDSHLGEKIRRRYVELVLRTEDFMLANDVKNAEGRLEKKYEERVHLVKGDTSSPYITKETVEVIENPKFWNNYSSADRKFYWQQISALDLCLKQPRALLAMQQRTGKTPVMVTLGKYRHEHDNIDLMLVVSTRTLIYTAWVDELNRYWPDAAWHHAINANERQIINHLEHDVILCTFESLGKVWPYIRNNYDTGRVMLVADETIKIKNPHARRTQSLLAASGEVGYCYLLSGAPVSRLHSDIFPQIWCLDPGLFGDDYHLAMERYFWSRDGSNLTFKRHAKDEFHSILDSIMFRCTRGESEQYKGRQTYTQNVHLKFHPLQAMLYKDLANSMLAMFESEDISAFVQATNILVLLGRLREVCGGFFSYEVAPGSYHRHRLPNNPKAKWLKEFFGTHETTQAVIFMEYNEEEEIIGDLLDELGISWGGKLRIKRERSGVYGVKDTELNKDEMFAKHIHEFQEGDRQVFVGKHSSIGHGLTLNAADVEIFYSLGFNSDNYDQARQRAVGKDSCVLVYHLMMGGSIEPEKIYAALSSRQDMKSVIMKDIGRRGYHQVFEEIAMSDLLVEDIKGGVEDILEREARVVINYHGPLTEEGLKSHCGSLGMGLFAKIKAAIGTCLGLKEAYKRVMIVFHPDMAVASGHEKDSDTYRTYNLISKAANAAYTESKSLGEFINAIGGKEPDAEFQKWYDYLLRKARSTSRVIGPERQIDDSEFPAA